MSSARSTIEGTRSLQVTFQRRVIKYGVVQADRLQVDLETWADLYISGRLHKPVLELPRAAGPAAAGAHAALLAAQQENLQFALAAALLRVRGGRFSWADLLRELVGISYTGDVRMGLAEDPRKIDRIVQGSREGRSGWADS